jgi:hypothetical protein
MGTARFSEKELKVFTAIVVVLFSALAWFISSTPTPVRDVDEIVYIDTLRAMQDDVGYYPAMRDALVAKEGEPPTQVRSFRTPVVFWTLSSVPESLWRLLAGLVFAASIAFGAHLAKPFGPYAPPIAAAGIGLMAISYSQHLYLHAEVWALPWILAGLIALRQKGAAAPWLMAFGLAVRELFALLFLFSIVKSWAVSKDQRRWWIAAGASVSAFGAYHAYRASGFVEGTGYEASFGNEKMNLNFLLSAVSPGDSPFGWMIGLLLLVAGTKGLLNVRKIDPIAPVVAGHLLLMVPLTLVLGRVYWGFTFVPLLAIYAPAAWSRPEISGQADDCDGSSVAVDLDGGAVGDSLSGVGR